MQANEMLLMIGLAAGLTALALTMRLTGRQRTAVPHLGWMSERWVAEQRVARQERTE